MCVLGVFVALAGTMLGQTTSASQSQQSQSAPPGTSNPTTLPDSPSQATTKAQQEERQREILRKEESQRMMGVIPNFAVVNQEDAVPLTSRQKFHLFAKSAFDPVEFVLVGAQAGISQAQDSFPAYGQGAEGYGKRYGAAFADQVSAGFFSNYLYPTVFKSDPRYFRLGQGPIKHRVVYAVEQVFVAHKDDGGRSFHYANVLGALTAGSISNAYYPSDDRGFGLTMSRAGIALLYGGLGAVADEFYPDLFRLVFHKHEPEPNPPDQKTTQEK